MFLGETAHLGNTPQSSGRVTGILSLISAPSNPGAGLVRIGLVVHPELSGERGTQDEKILITGAAGAIGTSLRGLLADTYRLWSSDLKMTRGRSDDVFAPILNTVLRGEE